MGFESHEIAAMPGISAWMAYAGHSVDVGSTMTYGKVLEFKDSVTGQILANRTFLVSDGGTIYKSKTDSQGRAIIEAPESHSINIHLVFSAPTGEMKYEL